MKLISVFFVMLFTSQLVAGPLQGPHQHGSLEVAIINDRDFLIFKMLMPSEDLLGFEDSPTTMEKKEKVSSQYEKLYQEAALPALFKFIPAGACEPQAADMVSDMLDYHEHDDIKDAVSTDARDVHSVGDDEGHSDFLLNYVFKCKKVDLIQITFHEVFPSIKRVNYYGGGELKGEPVLSIDAAEAFSEGFGEE